MRRHPLALIACLAFSPLSACTTSYVLLKDQTHLEGHIRRGDRQRKAIEMRVGGEYDPRWIRIESIESVEPPSQLYVWMGAGLAVTGAVATGLSMFQLADGTGEQVGYLVPAMTGGLLSLCAGSVWAGITASARSRSVEAVDRAGGVP